MARIHHKYSQIILNNLFTVHFYLARVISYTQIVALFISCLKLTIPDTLFPVTDLSPACQVTRPCALILSDLSHMLSSFSIAMFGLVRGRTRTSHVAPLIQTVHRVAEDGQIPFLNSILRSSLFSQKNQNYLVATTTCQL